MIPQQGAAARKVLEISAVLRSWMREGGIKELIPNLRRSTGDKYEGIDTAAFKKKELPVRFSSKADT